MKHLRTILVLVLVFVLAVQPLTLAAAPVTNTPPEAPTGLLTNESLYPMNVEGAPRFGWLVNDADYDEVQTAYEIRLYDGISGELTWDSGKVESELQDSVKYTGEPLKPGYPYSWEVSTWDAHGEQSPYSERAQFATGLTDADWGGDWIQGVQSGNSAPLKIVTTETNSTTVLNGGGLTLRNGNADWANYSLSAVLTLKSGAVGLAFRVSEDRQSGYVWQLVPGTGLVRNKLVGGQLTQLGEAVACEIAADNEYTFEIVAEGAQITTTLNGTRIDVYTDEAALAAGTFGFYAPEGAEAVLESLTATKKATELWQQVRGTTALPSPCTTTAMNGTTIRWNSTLSSMPLQARSCSAAPTLPPATCGSSVPRRTVWPDISAQPPASPSWTAKALWPAVSPRVRSTMPPLPSTATPSPPPWTAR